MIILDMLIVAERFAITAQQCRLSAHF